MPEFVIRVNTLPKASIRIRKELSRYDTQHIITSIYFQLAIIYKLKTGLGYLQSLVSNNKKNTQSR